MSGATYNLDIETLRSLLGKRSYTLTTRLTVQGRAAHGSITVVHGEITACSIHLTDGGDIAGEMAYALLRAQTQWQVHFSLLPQTAPAPGSGDIASPSPASGGRAIRQKKPVHPSLLEGFPLKQRLILRTVLAMVNGQRDAVAIKKHLRLSPAVVDEALSTLRSLDIIE